MSVHVSGVASQAEFRVLYEEIAADTRFRPGMRVLLDFVELDVSELEGRQAAGIGRHLAGLEDRYGAASLAVVVPNTLVFGLTKMAELAGSFGEIKVWVGYGREDGLRWLESQTETTDS